MAAESLTAARPSRTSRRRTRLTVAGATLAPVVPWLLAQATGTELEPIVNGEPFPVTLPLVIVAALFASVVGWAALAVLRRRSDRAAGIWTWLAIVALVGSLVPFPGLEAETAAKVYLALMHVAVAVVLIPGLRGTVAGRGSGFSGEH